MLDIRGADVTSFGLPGMPLPVRTGPCPSHLPLLWYQSPDRLMPGPEVTQQVRAEPEIQHPYAVKN
jgi:hypothetical protein